MSADSVPITPARFAAALKDLPLSSLHLKLLELRNSIAHLDYSNEQLRPYAEGTATAFSSAEAAAAAAATTTTTTTTTEPSAQQQQQQPQQQRQQAQQLTPDPDCAEAIRENEEVIARMQERIRLVRAEVESRGLSWAEFQGAGAGAVRDDGDADVSAEVAAEAAEEEEEEEEGEEPVVNGDGGVVNGVQVNGASATAEGGGGRGGEGNGGGGAGGREGQRHAAWTDGTFQTGVIRDGGLHFDAVAGSRPGRGPGGSLTDEELRRRMEEQLRGLGGDEEEGEDDADGGLHL
jgi:hypothetical protein